MRPLTYITALSLLLLSLFARADFDPIGTLTATLDGQERTWYIPGDETGDGGSGAMWMEVEAGTATVVLGGFESRAVRFGRDPETDIPSVEGEGSQISLSFQFPQGTQRLDTRLPAEGDEEVSLLLLPTVGDYRVMHGMDEGRLTVTTLETNRQGPSAFSGQFEGVLRDGDGEVVHRLKDGRFSVEGARFFALEETEAP